MRTWRKAIGVRRRMVVVGQSKRQLDRVVEWKPKAFLIILFISLLLLIIIIIVIVDIELVFFLLLLTFSSLSKEARG